MVVFNDGFPGREEPVPIGAPPFIGIPVVMTSASVGAQLYNAVQAGTVNVTMMVDATTTEVTQYNLTADTEAGDPDRTVVVGAHLDSVEEGPGINDNGSGSGTLIEMAEEIAKLDAQPRNRIRFAWWGAEESGLVGSTAYVADLIESGEIDDIEANLNFDMLASPNFVRFVYDGDNSTGEGAEGPPGSAEIEQVFLDYFEEAGSPAEPTPFSGRSDYGPFIAPAAFVPAGGLFSGAEGVKTEEQAAIYGGAAGSWYDPCYHQACDTFDTVVYQPPPDADGLEAGQEAADAALMRGNGAVGLGQLADGAAHATWTLARSRSPLVGPAEARAARTAKARRSLRERPGVPQGPRSTRAVCASADAHRRLRNVERAARLVALLRSRAIAGERRPRWPLECAWALPVVVSGQRLHDDDVVRGRVEYAPASLRRTVGADEMVGAVAGAVAGEGELGHEVCSLRGSSTPWRLVWTGAELVDIARSRLLGKGSGRRVVRNPPDGTRRHRPNPGGVGWPTACTA